MTYLSKLNYYSVIAIISVVTLASSFTGIQEKYAQAIVICLLTILFLLQVKNITRKLLHNSFININYILMCFYITLLVIAYFRSAYTGIVTIVFAIGVVIFWVLIFASFSFMSLKALRISNSQYLLRWNNSIYYSVGFYIVINILLYLMNFNKYDLYGEHFHYSQIFGYLGINWSRVFFPLSPGINSMGIIAGAVLTTTSIMLVFFKQHIKRWILLLLFLSALFVILATDSRGALIYSLFIIIFLRLIPIQTLRWLPFFILLLPIIPIIILGVSDLFNEYFSMFSRSGGSILSNREIIWDVVIKHFSDFSAIHFVGYGFMGQDISNIALKYQHLFSHWDVNYNSITVHNSYFQLLVDIGYIGLFLFLTLLFFIIRIIVHRLIKINTKKDIYIVHLGFILYISIAGLTEVAFSVYNYQLFIMFIFVSLNVIYHKDRIFN